MESWLLDGDKLQVLCMSVAFWTVLFAQVCCFIHPNLGTAEKNWDVRNRVVSFAHGLLVIAYSSIRLTSEMNYGAENSHFENVMINISMGYFVYDTLCMIFTNTHSTFILIHHALVISGIYCCLVFNIAATDIMAGFFISEVSNPFMHIKEIMKTLNLTTTRFFLWNEISFYIIYMILYSI